MAMNKKLDNDLFEVTLSKETLSKGSDASSIRLSMESSIVIAEVQAAYLKKIEQQLEEQKMDSDIDYKMISTSLKKFTKKKESLIGLAKRVLAVPVDTLGRYNTITAGMQKQIEELEGKTETYYDNIKEHLEEVDSPDFINLVDTTKIEEAVQEAMTLPPKSPVDSKKVPVEDVVDSVMQKLTPEEKEEEQTLSTSDFKELFESLKKNSMEEEEEPVKENSEVPNTTKSAEEQKPAETSKSLEGEESNKNSYHDEPSPAAIPEEKEEVETVDFNIETEPLNVSTVSFNTPSDYAYTDYASTERSNGSTLEFDSIDMKSLRSLKAESEDELRNVTATVEAKKSTLEDKTALLNEKEKESEELDELVKQAKEALAVLAEIEENKQKAQEQQSLLNSFDTEIKTTDTKIAEKDRRIELQKRELEESKERLTRLQETGLLAPIKETKASPAKKR